MKSELSFLLELILDDSIPKPIKTRLVTRIREVEKNYVTASGSNQSLVPSRRPIAVTPIIAAQSPSMQRLMADNPDLIPKVAEPVTPQAAVALAHRAAIINGAAKEKPEAGRTSPRKF